MNSQNLKLCEKLIPGAYVKQGGQSLKAFENRVHHLLEQRRWPDEGWSDPDIERLLGQLAAMDSNNFPGNCGVGERESRLASSLVARRHFLLGHVIGRSGGHHCRPAQAPLIHPLPALTNKIIRAHDNTNTCNCGVGERESRLASSLVARRHFLLGHGIGRSGDITAVQPKAAGSSVLVRLTNSMLLDLVQFCGAKTAADAFLVPMATGMTLTLCLLTLKRSRPLPEKARYVIWPRIDQKSCFKCNITAGLEPIVVENILEGDVPLKIRKFCINYKRECGNTLYMTGLGESIDRIEWNWNPCIITSGLEPIVVENLLEGDELRTNVKAVDDAIRRVGTDSVCCVLTTTSCFAPRAPDRLEEIAALCKEHDIPHLVNNAYGLQSSKCMHLIEHAHKTGRLDLFVQSTDKNLLVPVGGAIVSGFDKNLLESVGKMYPGRASATPTIDVFITLLSLGRKGYRQLLQERKEMFVYLHKELERCAQKHAEKLLKSSHNSISMAMSLHKFKPEVATELGSMLFTRFVSGTRVVATRGEAQTVSGYTFEGFGAHTMSYPCPYLTAAAAIGVTKSDIDQFIKRLDKAMHKIKKTGRKRRSTKARKAIDAAVKELENMKIDDGSAHGGGESESGSGSNLDQEEEQNGVPRKRKCTESSEGESSPRSAADKEQETSLKGKEVQGTSLGSAQKQGTSLKGAETEEQDTSLDSAEMERARLKDPINQVENQDISVKPAEK